MHMTIDVFIIFYSIGIQECSRSLHSVISMEQECKSYQFSLQLQSYIQSLPIMSFEV